ALNRVARDAEFLRDGVGGAKSDAMNGAREYVRIAPYDVERVLAIELVDAPCVRGSQAVPAQKDRQLAKTGRVAPRCRDCPRNYGSDPGDFAHAFGSVVEHFAERVSEIFGDSTRERRADALYFRSEVAFERDRSGGPHRFEIHHVKLIAKARMLFEAALSADGRANFQTGKISNHGDAAGVAVFAGNDDDGDRVTVFVVNKQDLIEDALQGLGRLMRLCHGKRITRGGRRVQLMATGASTSSAIR